MDDLISEFISETSESLTALDEGLNTLERNPHDRTVFAHLSRLLHTIKGASSFLTLPRLAAVSHAAEKLLTALRGDTREVSAETVALVLEMFGRIKFLIDSLAEDGAEAPGNDSDLIARLTAAAANGGIMNALKRSVQNAAPATKVASESKLAPATKVAPEPAAPSAKTEQVPAVATTAPATTLSPKAQEKAIQQGLDTALADMPESVRSRRELYEQVMQMVSEMLLTRSKLHHAAQRYDDPELQTPLTQMAQLIQQLQEKLLNARPQLTPTPGHKNVVLLVEAAGQRFAIAQSQVLELVRVGPMSAHRIEARGDHTVLHLRNHILPLLSLREVLQLGQSEALSKETYIVLLQHGERMFGLAVDRIHDIMPITPHRLSRVFGRLKTYAGATLLDDGGIVMILDAPALAAQLVPTALAIPHLSHAATRANFPARSSNVPAHTHYETFLVFTSDGIRKAVPLSHVVRLETINAAQIERAHGMDVVPCRGEKLQLLSLEPTLPQEGECDVIVLRGKDRMAGLMIDSIVDIAVAAPPTRLAAQEENYLGSTVIGGKTTDVIDAAHLLEHQAQVQADNARKHGALHGTRVLLVEDDPFFRALVVPYLTNAGIDVVEATSPPELWALTKTQQPFDVVVIDTDMPRLDGFALAKRLRNYARFLEVPILAFTLAVNQDVNQNARAAGMNGLVLKTNHNALLYAIAGVLHRVEEVA